ncbi:hypothetical protein ACA910_021930 [Epithemia clementina (nom. ined.)]
MVRRSRTMATLLVLQWSFSGGGWILPIIVFSTTPPTTTTQPAASVVVVDAITFFPARQLQAITTRRWTRTTTLWNRFRGGSSSNNDHNSAGESNAHYNYRRRRGDPPPLYNNPGVPPTTSQQHQTPPVQDTAFSSSAPPVPAQYAMDPRRQQQASNNYPYPNHPQQPPPKLPPPDLPDDLPPYQDGDQVDGGGDNDDDDDDDVDDFGPPSSYYPPNAQSPPLPQYPYTQQQQQYGQPPLPGSGPLPPHMINNHNNNIPPAQPSPTTTSTPTTTTATTSAEQLWDDTSGNKDATGGMDLSSFDKEYILRGLARLYRRKILPLEIASRYGHFSSPPLSPADFDAPPMILLLGQYSVGKTSFIKYLLGRDFPGIRIGPEPTTDRFTAVLWGNQDKVIPGAALCSQSHRPFTGLNPFGNNFLSRMEGSELDAPILRNVTLVDTPGILSGQKQRARNYDYEGVMKWFAERSDLIIIMFDAYKLDISDELKRVMHLMTPHSDKIRIVLNKADSVSTQQLMRVYGALMWQLGKVMNTPEVARVYLGSFWDVPLQNTDQAELLNREEMDLLHDIAALPQYAVMRRINEMVKRARSVKVHAYIIHYLRKQLPYTWGRREKQKRLIARLDAEFMAAARRYGLPKGDFPPLEPMRQALYEIKDLSEFPKLDKKFVREMDKVFSVDIPELLEKARHQ